MDNNGLVIAGIVNAILAVVCLASKNFLVQEQGREIGDLKLKKNARSSMVMTFLISLAIMTIVTCTFYLQ